MKNWRINFLFSLFLIFIALILYRLYSLQILEGELSKALAEGIHDSYPFQEKERGEIFFSKFEPLAINKDYFFVYAINSKIKNRQETAEKLSQILGIDEKIILEKLSSEKNYQLIKNKLTDEEIEKLKKEKIEGIFLESGLGRYYPQGKLAAQVVGFLDQNGNGNYGLEEFYDQTLKEGGNLVLTLDYALQFKAEELLEKAKQELDIKSGQIIVIDPYSGKILAMANFPSFDPNEYSKVAKESLEVFKNKTTLEIFEPGSVFKPITMAVGLNEEKITPETEFFDKGFFQIGQIKIQNYDNRAFGQVSMINVLEKSINTGAVFVETQIPHPIFLDYLQKFGIFKSTGVDLPEIYSENKEFKKGYEINFATASFGQGIEMTPLQLVRAYCALVNGGKLVKPYVVEKIITKEGMIEKKPEFSENIISEKTSTQLKSMLLSVVENGFGKRAKIPGYYVAGKTGTSQIPFSSLGISQKGYSDQTWQTFIGFVPAFSPKFLIMVKLDNPKAKTAEYSAVPIFRELAEFALNFYQIPQDYEID
jgi:cell division protein FtsI/penicillin-binding protein 2